MGRILIGEPRRLPGRIYDLPKGKFERRCYQIVKAPMPRRMYGLRSLYRMYRQQGIRPDVARMATIGAYCRWMEPGQ